MAFRPKFNFEGKTVLFPVAASMTFAKGDGCHVNTSGLMETSAVGQDYAPTYIAMQDSVTAASGTLALFLRITPDAIFEADCSAAVAQSVVGDYIDMATKSTLDPAASTDDLFFVEKVVGTAGTSTIVQGRFVEFVPQSNP